MSNLEFAGVMFAAYVCGLVGSIRGMIRDAEPLPKQSKDNAFVIFLWFFVVLSYWKLEIAKIVIAAASVYLLDGTGYALVGSCLICFVSGFVTMRYGPALFGPRAKVAEPVSHKSEDENVTKLTERALNAREKLVTALHAAFDDNSSTIKARGMIIPRFCVGIGPSQSLWVLVAFTDSEWSNGHPTSVGGMSYSDFLAAIPQEIDGLKVKVCAKGLDRDISESQSELR